MNGIGSKFATVSGVLRKGCVSVFVVGLEKTYLSPHILVLEVLCSSKFVPCTHTCV